MLCFEVVAFDSESLNTIYHFNLDVFGFYSDASNFLSPNTLPSNTSDLSFPGFFHPEPSSRLLALEVHMSDSYFGIRGDNPVYVLYVPHDVLIDYMKSHPSDSHTVIVPWEAWGHGNVQILTFPRHFNRLNFLSRKIVCGMHAIITEAPGVDQGDQRMLRIMDYHPRRIFRNSVTGATGTQDTHLRGAADSHKRLRPPGTPARQEATDETIPCVFKDIPLPGGLDLENIRCALGEDVVAVFVVGIPSLLMVRYEGSHSVQGFYCTFLPFSTDREYFLSPHLARLCPFSFFFPTLPSFPLDPLSIIRR